MHDSLGNWQWEYNLGDHLGNKRAVIYPDNDNNIHVEQETHYYPFGLAMGNMGFTPTNNPNQYLYNGKELQNDLDLGWYDYGARFYEPAAPHWTTPDPLAEKYFSTSPFAYVQNNPIRYLDPFGMEGKDPNKENENVVIVDKELIEEFLRSINFFFLNNDNGTNDDTDLNNSKGDNKKTKKRTKEYDQEFGYVMYSELGQGTKTTARHKESLGNIDGWFALWGSSGVPVIDFISQIRSLDFKFGLENKKHVPNIPQKYIRIDTSISIFDGKQPASGCRINIHGDSAVKGDTQFIKIETQYFNGYFKDTKYEYKDWDSSKFEYYNGTK